MLLSARKGNTSFADTGIETLRKRGDVLIYIGIFCGLEDPGFIGRFDAEGNLYVAAIAFNRGESIDALWFIVAAICVYAVGYRFYSAFLAAKVLALDPTRATPAPVQKA